MEMIGGLCDHQIMSKRINVQIIIMPSMSERWIHRLIKFEKVNYIRILITK